MKRSRFNKNLLGLGVLLTLLAMGAGFSVAQTPTPADLAEKNATNVSTPIDDLEGMPTGKSLPHEMTPPGKIEGIIMPIATPTSSPTPEPADL